MKNLFKSLLVGALLLGSIAVTQAAQISESISGASTNSHLTVGGAVTKITVANSSGATATLQLFDAPSTSLTYVIAAHTNVSRSVSTITNTVVTRNGATNTWTYDVLSETESITAASTNNYRSLVILTVPNGETFTYTPSSPVVALQGILSTNSTNVDLTIDYTTIR